MHPTCGSFGILKKLNDDKITVLMTVYNGESYIRTAIDSILNQTYKQFRFLIVDDASTDSTRNIIESYDDKRIDMLFLENNIGQTAALNVGLKHIKTLWVARMDADDYSSETRLAKQMRLITENASISCVGTWAWTFRDDPKVVEGEVVTQLNHQDIKRALLRGSPIIHGSLLVKLSVLNGIGGYDERYRYAADVELYDRLLLNCISANIPEQLLGIRRHSSQGAHTTLALNEGIEILSKRLCNERYSSDDVKIIKLSLAGALVIRARRLLGNGEFIQMGKELLSAGRISHTGLIFGFFRYFIGYTVPERQRARLRTFLVNTGLSKHPNN